MIEMKIFIFGESQMFYYLVHDREHPEQVNKKYKQVYKSFGITEGALPNDWIGAMGHAYVRNRVSQFDGSDEAYIAYFVSPDRVPVPDEATPAANFGKVLAAEPKIPASPETEAPF
jgi:hypothetical protein